MPEFDPSQPFEVVDQAAPGFDPSQPFDVVAAEEPPKAGFTSQPFERDLIQQGLAGMRAGRQAFSERAEAMRRPLINITPRDVARVSPVLALLQTEVGVGMAEGMANVASAATTPESIALAGAAMLQPQIAAGVFGGLMAKEAGTKLGEASVAAEIGETQEAAKLATEGAAAGAMALAPVGPARAGVRSIPPVLERAKTAGLPEAAKALEAEAGIKPRPFSSEEMAVMGGAEPAFGIVPKEAQALQKAIDYFTPPTPTAIPELKIETGARLPRLQAYETEKLLATSPEGMARVPVLGALMDPRATAKTAPDAAIIARAYSTHKGRTFAALWGESQFRNKELFMADESGTIPLTNGERGYISDVIEAEIRDPGSQSISPQQRSWINDEWKPLLEDTRKMLEDEGVREVVTDDMAFDVANDYFPRPAIGKVNRDAAPSGQTGGRPGATPFFDKSRKYETEFEGARPPNPGETKEQIQYDPDAISRSMKFILGAYRAVADHRLANDASLGGQTIAERFSVLKEKHGDKLSMLDEAERGEFEAQLREQAAYPVWGKEEALHIAPAFQGKIYPIESSTKLKTAYAEEVRGWVRQAANMTGAAKSMMATADMSAPFVQGAMVMARHPVRWAKATANSYRSLLDPDVMGKVLEKPENRTAAEEFSQSGGSLLQLEDFLSGMRKEAPTTKIPVFGKVVESTGRAYGVFLDMAKLELWKAWSKGVDKSEWGRVAESIENSLFMGRMEKIGLNPHRAIGERLMAFAPAYYRGAGGVISTAFQKGVPGDMMRQMLGSYAAAGTLATVGSLLAQGASWDEIEDRLNPVKGTFMKVPIETADGKRVEVGIGNVLTQLVRLGGQAIDYHTSDKPIDTGVENNPYLRFLRGRAAMIPSLAIELSTGRDYFGNRITAKEAVARRFMPFALQSMFPREETAPSQRVMDTAFTFFGLNAFPESEYAEQLRRLDDSVKAKSGKPFMELPLSERALAAKEFKESGQFKKREPTVTDMERFVHINEQRERSVRGKLSESTKSRLDELGLPTSGYKSTVNFKGVDVPLSKAEQLRYEALLVEEYDRAVSDLPAALKDVPQVKRDEWWGKYRQQIGESARKKLMIEMQQSQPTR